MLKLLRAKARVVELEQKLGIALNRCEDMKAELKELRKYRDTEGELGLLRELHKLPDPMFKPGDIVRHKSSAQPVFVVRSVRHVARVTYGEDSAIRLEQHQTPEYEVSRVLVTGLDILRLRECEIEVVR